MKRIVAIDYGSKRVGIAVTDPMQIIATGLTTVHAKNVIALLKDYIQKEKVECFVVGEPKNLDNSPAQSAPLVKAFIDRLKKIFPNIPVKMIDERFTSKMAKQTMVMSGLKKKDRRKKETIDEISATIILQSYLESKDNQ